MNGDPQRSASRTQLAFRRSIDLAVALSGLITACPVLLAAAAAIKLESPGPLIYRSVRVGMEHRNFYLLKLRTMCIDQDPKGPQVTSAKDERITRVGRFLRKTKIDEIPQLLNVILGDISLVGPRPEAPKYVDLFPKEYEKILHVKPGLSDQATLKFIDEEDILAKSEDPERYYAEFVLPQKLAINLAHLHDQGILQYVGVIAQTVMQIVSRTYNQVKRRI